jgi:short subunit dehydrogenase-like uncharacterized protein
MGSSRRQIARLRRLTPWLGLLGTKPFKRTLQWWIRQRVSGPSEEIRDSARSYFWGCARNGEGEAHAATLETPEGYKLTAMTAVECVTRVLNGEVKPGSSTPAMALGPEFIKAFEGVSASW